MDKHSNNIKAYLLGSLGIFIYFIITIMLSLLIKNNGIVYFISGICCFFGLGFYFVKLSNPISPLSVLLIIPCMFAGTYLSEYIQLKNEIIVQAKNPRDIFLYNSSNYFELSNYLILNQYKNTIIEIKKIQDRSSKISVTVVPIVNQNWMLEDKIEIFATCEENFENNYNCENAFLIYSKFAKLINSQTSNHDNSLNNAAIQGGKKYNLNLSENLKFIELITDIELYANNKKKYGIIIFLSFLFLWIFVSILIEKYENSTRKEN
jgi:hypothetical protein